MRDLEQRAEALVLNPTTLGLRVAAALPVHAARD